jgi:hypothetical protein
VRRGVPIKDKLKSIGRRRDVRYALTLPERTVRSVSALTAGVVREIADVALPIGVRRGRLYRNLVDVTLKFLIEDVGEVPRSAPAEAAIENFLLRRAAGNGLELMGVLAFRASPVWVLAALADVCGLGRQLLPEIAAALREEGLLRSDQSFATMDQLLRGLEGSAAQLASTVNTPPLDVAGLREEWTKLAAEARQLPAPRLPSPTAIVDVWRELRAEAAVQQRSVFELSSLLAISAVSELPERVRVLSKSAALALGRSGAVLSEGLLDHYRQSLREIHEAGFLSYGRRQLAPYARAALAAFAPSRGTLTERWLDRL